MKRITKSIENLTTSILDNTGLNWGVEAKPLFGGEGERTPYFGMFRDDNDACLGALSSRYVPLSNRELIEVATRYFGKNLKVESVTGGELNGGKNVFFKIRQKELFTGSTAKMQRFFCLKNSFDGSSGVQGLSYDEVEICTNGMTRDTLHSKINIRHSSTMAQKLEQFDELYASFLNFEETMQADYEFLMARKATKADALAFISFMNKCDATLPEGKFLDGYSQRKYSIVQQQLELTEMEMKRQGRTFFGMLQGLTNYTSHHLRGNTTTPEQRQANLIEGGAYYMNRKGLNYLLETAKS